MIHDNYFQTLYLGRFIVRYIWLEMWFCGNESLYLTIGATLYEQRREKTGFLHMRKQRHRSASR